MEEYKAGINPATTIMSYSAEACPRQRAGDEPPRYLKNVARPFHVVLFLVVIAMSFSGKATS